MEMVAWRRARNQRGTLPPRLRSSVGIACSSNMRTVLILMYAAPVRLLPLAALLLAVALAGCGAATNASNGRLRVVAAENFWGSIAAQLGGNRVQVMSVIHNPATDPHDYEPTPSDARAMA